ncbi:MAG: ATP-binding protein, partial [Gammaproteobacteria bacterium]|nr:ATP-binding protein [Gammaproteobacteria bacterium]
MRAVLAAVESAAVGRAREARALVLAACCGQHALLVGPPGAGKSLLCRALAGAVRARYFELLL